MPKIPWGAPKSFVVSDTKGGSHNVLMLLSNGILAIGDDWQSSCGWGIPSKNPYLPLSLVIPLKSKYGTQILETVSGRLHSKLMQVGP